jgi:hypothetical protein
VAVVWEPVTTEIFTSPASGIAQNKIHTILLKDEIKFLHMKKEKNK